MFLYCVFISFYFCYSLVFISLFSVILIMFYSVIMLTCLLITLYLFRFFTHCAVHFCPVIFRTVYIYTFIKNIFYMFYYIVCDAVNVSVVQHRPLLSMTSCYTLKNHRGRKSSGAPPAGRRRSRSYRFRVSPEPQR